MLVAKINPPVKIAQQIDRYSYLEITGSYMCATTQKYVLGADSARFNVIFGELLADNTFKPLNRNMNDVSGATIDSWGTDDTIVLEKLAELNGTSVTETLDVNIDLDGIV